VKPFVRESPLSSAWGQHHPPLGLVAGGHVIVVATELGEGEARERIDDIEPQWLVVCMEGEEEIGLPVEGAGPLANVSICSGARYEANPIKVSATPIKSAGQWKGVKTRVANYPLTIYAARYWIDHARFDDVSSRIEGAMERRFDPAKSHFATWVWVYNIDLPFWDILFTPCPTRPRLPHYTMQHYVVSVVL